MGQSRAVENLRPTLSGWHFNYQDEIFWKVSDRNCFLQCTYLFGAEGEQKMKAWDLE